MTRREAMKFVRAYRTYSHPLQVATLELARQMAAGVPGDKAVEIAVAAGKAVEAGAMKPRWKRVEIKAMLAMLDKSKGGASVREIAEAHGCSVSQAKTWIGHAERYRRGLALLAENPKSIDGLVLTGRLMLGHWSVYQLTQQYGMTSLDDLTKWSRHELMRLQNVGATKVSYIEAAMSKLGLSLRDDGEFIEHEYCAAYLAEQEESSTRRLEQQVEQLADDWANRDREFITGQARAVTSIFRRAWCFLKDGRDDPELFKVIARALQRIPPIGNPVYKDLGCVEEAEKSEAARTAELEEAARTREAANRRIAELVREAGTLDGNVIAFPIAAMRAAAQMDGAPS